MKKKSTIQFDERELRKRAIPIFLRNKAREIGRFLGWVFLILLVPFVLGLIGGLLTSYISGSSPSIYFVENSLLFSLVGWWMLGCGIGFVCLNIFMIVKETISLLKGWISDNWRRALREAERQSKI